jgi:hypothetical protein
MANEARAILELPDGTRFDIDGRAALIVMMILFNQAEINRVETGALKATFQGEHVHPLRLTSSLLTVSLPTVLR